MLLDPTMPKRTTGRNRPTPRKHASSLIIEPPSCPINPSSVSWLVAIRAMIGVVTLLTALDLNHRQWGQKRSAQGTTVP